MITEFIVEQVIQVKGHKPYIVVRHLTPEKSFSVSEKSFLNGISIESLLISPRVLNKSGEPRFDLYVFYPMHSNDISQFEKDTIVVLTTEDRFATGNR